MISDIFMELQMFALEQREILSHRISGESKTTPGMYIVVNANMQENPYLSFPRSQFGSNFHQPAAVEMASGKPTLESVERALNNWLRPQLLGESWDNIGLLVGSGKYEKNEKSISSIILCNDLMPRVLDEAISKNADMILAYHPPIFTGMKSVAYGNWKERIVARCLANDISIYSPHTTLDSVVNGINDRVLNALRTGSNKSSKMRAILPSSAVTEETRGIQVTSNADEIGQIFDKVQLQNYRDTLVALEINGSSSTLTIYSKCSFEKIATEIQSIGIGSIKDVQSETNPIFGAGRIVDLNEPVDLHDAVELVQKHLDLGYVQLAYGGNPTIKSAAVCVGSGSSLLKPLAGKVDLLITGEMSHHDILECVVKKSSLILCNHCSSERHYLKDLARTLKVVTGVENVMVSEEDCSPLRLVLK